MQDNGHPASLTQTCPGTASATPAMRNDTIRYTRCLDGGARHEAQHVKVPLKCAQITIYGVTFDAQAWTVSIPVGL